MQKQSVIHNTFAFERSFTAAPERVFAAFADPEQKRRWFVEGSHHDLEQYELDFRAGGWERARFRFKEGTPVQGMVCSSETVYQDIVPNRRIVLASSMALGGKCISAELVTFEFLLRGAGTDLLVTHQGAFFEDSDGPEIRQEGWRKLLENLRREVSE